VDLGLVDQSQKHVAIVVDEAHFALRSHLDLVELHFNDFGCVLDHLGGRLTRHDIKDADDLGRHRVDQGNNIT
jgi:hypothetical protein